MNDHDEAEPSSNPGIVAPGQPKEETNRRGGRMDIEGAADEVEEALVESFPASDPPSFTPITSLGSPAHKK